MIVQSRGVQTRSRPARPTNPPDLYLISTWTDAPVGQFRVSMPKAQCQWVEWQVFFSKTWATRPDRGYIQIRRNQAQIRGDPASSQPYLMRFSQIQRFPADFSNFGADFGKFNADLVSFYIFRRWFGRSRRCFFFFFLQISMTFIAPATNQNRPNKPDLQSNPKPTWPIDTNDRFQVTLFSTWRRQVGFELGRKSTWLDQWIVLVQSMIFLLMYEFFHAFNKFNCIFLIV